MDSSYNAAQGQGFIDNTILKITINKKDNSGVSWNIIAVFQKAGEGGDAPGTKLLTPVVNVSGDTEQQNMGKLETNCLSFISYSTNGCLWKLTATPLSSAYALNYIQIGEDETTRVYSEDGKTITWEVTENGAQYIAYFTVASISLGDTIYYAPAKDSSDANFPSSMASNIYTGQMVRIAVPYSVLGETSGQNLSLQVYAGKGTTGQLLYDGALVKNFVVDSMPQISKLTVVAKYNDSEPTVKTYDIQVGTPGTMELTKTNASGNGYGVAAFWNEASSALNLYYATSSGVYQTTADGVTKMEGTQGEAIAVGGASEDALYAITTTYDYSSAGYTYYLTYHLYEYANGQWNQLDDSYAVKETSGMDYTKYQAALIMDGSSIWLGDVHWDGDSWETNDVSFNSFWKADADTAYAGSSNGVYQYKNGSWTQVSGTSGTMYITSGACTGETVTLVTAESRTSEIDRIAKHYYNEKTSGTIKKVVISDSNAIVTAVDTSAIPVCSGILTVSIRQFVGVAADGTLYAITDGKETVDNQFLSYSGSYLYKLVDGVWVYQDVPAYNQGSKDYIRHFTSPCEGVTLFLGFQGCNYIYYSGQTTITFESNGGSEVEPITGTIGNAVTAPKSPTRSGYVFRGWYSDAELKNAWTWNVMPAKDVTLYAKWMDRNNPGVDEDLDAERTRAKAGLDAALARLTETDYSAENWQQVMNAYNAGVKAIEAAEEYDAIYDALNEAIAKMLAVEADQAGVVTVAISMDSFVLGDYGEYKEKYGAGYIIEPTLVEVPKYTKVSTIITDLLREQYGDGEDSQPWTMTGTVETDFYLASVQLDGDKWLGEFDCGDQSGWMYSVNNVFPNVGASAYTVSYGDIIRWQYTASGLGADLGTSAEWADGDVATVANKDKLTWKVAELEKAVEDKTLKIDGPLLNAYNNAYEVLTNHHSTQAAVDAALELLNNAEEAKKAVDLIEAIKDVTLDSKDKIEAAEAAYDALTDAQKELVSNYKKLLDAREAYDALVDQAAADEVIDLINAIGKVNHGSKNAIEAAREAYDALSDAQKALVTNYQTLVDAEKAYDKLPVIPVVPGTPTAPSKPSTPAVPEAPSFTDISGHWATDAIEYAVANGLMNGVGNGRFAPNEHTTRGMIVTILARLEGVDTSKGGTWYEAGQQWAMKLGISDGTNMDGQITREQLATMLYRYAQLKGYDVSTSASLNAFTDASSVSDWAVEAMQWAVGTGLMEGNNNQLSPTAPATRAQVATLLMRFIEKLAK